MMSELDLVQKIAVMAIPLVFAITVHEASHAIAARRLGDDTADRLGRVSLNPIKHIDLVGTIIVPLVMMMFSPFLFGWAKPVPVNWSRLHNPRRDMGLVALAGPLANLVMALLWTAVIQICLNVPASYSWVAIPLIYMGAVGVLINGILMILNLLPILPLDGGRILTAVLPESAARQYSRLEPFGLIIILLLLMTEQLSALVWTPLKFFIESLQVAPVVFRVLS